MSQMSDYLEGKLIDHIFRTGTFTKPTTLAVGLFTAAPVDAGGGTEVTGGSYARAVLNPLNTNWDAPVSGDGFTANTVPITFATPTANWGTVSHFGLFDATTSGNLLIWGPLAPASVISTGDTVTFQPGMLAFTFK